MWKVVTDKVRDEEKQGRLQMILQEQSALAKTNIYTITYQESPGGSRIDKPQVIHLWPFDLEGPAFNLLFNSMISSK